MTKINSFIVYQGHQIPVWSILGTRNSLSPTTYTVASSTFFETQFFSTTLNVESRNLSARRRSDLTDEKFARQKRELLVGFS